MTLSPSESSVASIPSRFMAAAASSADSTVIPATNRLESLRPIADRSENLRSVFCRDIQIKNERNNS